jgi:hypothetical protein
MFKLEINTENSAFYIECGHPDTGEEALRAGPELARILRDLADRLERDGCTDSCQMILRDINGNACGLAAFDAPPKPRAAS